MLQISIPILTLAQNLQPLLMTMECPEGIILQLVLNILGLDKSYKTYTSLQQLCRKLSSRRLSRGNIRNVIVNGSCCLKIFSKSNYRGMFEVLTPGGHCGYNISKIRSFRFDECENQYSSTTTPSTTTTTLTTTSKYETCFLLKSKLVHQFV